MLIALHPLGARASVGTVATELYMIPYRLRTDAHDDVIKWKHFPRYRSPVDSHKKGWWRRALMFSLICAWTNGWANNRDAVDLIRHRVHYDVTVMSTIKKTTPSNSQCTLKGKWYLSIRKTCFKLGTVCKDREVNYFHNLRHSRSIYSISSNNMSFINRAQLISCPLKMMIRL